MVPWSSGMLINRWATRHWMSVRLQWCAAKWRCPSLRCVTCIYFWLWLPLAWAERLGPCGTRAWLGFNEAWALSVLPPVSLSAFSVGFFKQHLPGTHFPSFCTCTQAAIFLPTNSYWNEQIICAMMGWCLLSIEPYKKTRKLGWLLVEGNTFKWCLAEQRSWAHKCCSVGKRNIL